MKFGFNFGLFGKGKGGPGNNSCIVVGSVGTIEGYLYSSHGSANPDHTVNGVLFFGFNWMKDGSDPEVVIQFGPGGTDKLTDDIHTILINIWGRQYKAIWNDTDLAYNIVDQPLVDDLMLLNDGDKLCMAMFAVPDNFIDYDFNKRIGDKGC